jgi:hypothetical protein
MTRDKHKLLKQTTIFLFASVIVFCAFGAHAENIDPDGTGCKYAWAENAGWINFKPAQGSGVTVTDTAVAGMAWGENIGWINLSPTGGGVIRDGDGNLSGYAWGENVGWINFAPGNGGVKVDPLTGLFSGWAWGENIGWINFSIGQRSIKTSFIAFNTPPGSNISVSPPGSRTTITFSNVSSPGNTSVTISSSGPTPPAGFQLGNPPTYYNISTTASYTTPVTVCIIYNPAQYTDPSTVRLFHYESGAWVDITTSNNTTTHTLCGQANSLSPFVIAQSANQPPVAVCQNVTAVAGSTCTATASIDKGSYEPNGDPVALTQAPTGPYPLGTTPVTLTVTDSKNPSSQSQCTGTVTVQDKTSPAITMGSVSPSVLWPPNHKMVNVTIIYNATDNCGQPVCKISSVTSNESISRSDYAIVDAHHVKLTADRLGSGNGRIYTITITCKDASGNSSSQALTVTVPHDQGKTKK